VTLRLLYAVWCASHLLVFTRGRWWGEGVEPEGAHHLLFALVAGALALSGATQEERAATDPLAAEQLRWPPAAHSGTDRLRVALLRGALVAAVFALGFAAIAWRARDPVLPVVAFGLTLGAAWAAAGLLEMAADRTASAKNHASASIAVALVTAGGVIAALVQAHYAYGLRQGGIAASGQAAFEGMISNAGFYLSIAIGAGVAHGTLAAAHLRRRRMTFVALGLFLAAVVSGGVGITILFEPGAGLPREGAWLSGAAVGMLAVLPLAPGAAWCAAKLMQSWKESSDEEDERP
jgi:hypothetical protein